jgi:uncharacterized protein YndB with AHSA1/START domain
MSREFELRKEVVLDASPEQVWDAVATGQGISSWFMGPHDVEHGEGGRVTLEIGDFRETSTITAWDPPKHFAHRTDRTPDGSFHALEYVIEGRAGGTTVLRFVHSGFVGGDWGDEYVDQTSHGWDMYLHTLAQYLKHFQGRYATYVSVEAAGPTGADAWGKVLRGLGLDGRVAVGDRVRLTPGDIGPIEGVVDWVAPAEVGGFLGVVATDAMYRFHGAHALGHHMFSPVQTQDERRAWQSWLDGVLARTAAAKS